MFDVNDDFDDEVDVDNVVAPKGGLCVGCRQRQQQRNNATSKTV